MSDSYHDTAPCKWQESQPRSCAGKNFPYQFEGNHYCLLHFPNEGKDAGGAFTRTLNEKIHNHDYNLRRVWFPTNYSCAHTFENDADFTEAVFNGEADFSQATFRGKINFNSAKFRQDAVFLKFQGDADFNAADFKARAIFADAVFGGEANFYDVVFGANGGISFRNATFEKNVSFAYAQFHFGAGFEDANFKGDATFKGAVFDDYVSFLGNKTNQVFDDEHELDFQVLKIVYPEKVSFRFVRLRPRWLVHVDPRKFDFNKVSWWPKTEWWRSVVRLEIEALQTQVMFPSDLLVTVCQRLAVNHEENDYFEDASRFRYMAMAVRQREVARGWPVWKLSWWYWLASGFGERTLQAALILIVLWILFSTSFFYFQGNDWWESSQSQGQGTTITTQAADSAKPQQEKPPETTTVTIGTTGAKALGLPTLREALIYSAGVMTLQKPEPQPGNTRAKFLVLLATILGPVQAALLALAVRRKFMR